MSRADVVEQILNQIFELEGSIYKDTLKKVIASNAEAGGSVKGYYYFGERFCLLKPYELTNKQLPTIHTDLEKDAHYVRELLQRREKDRQKIKQSLVVVVAQCNDLQDIFDSLPSLFTNGIQTYQGFTRTRDPLYNFTDNALFLTQFEKAEKLAEYYLMNRILL